MKTFTNKKQKIISTALICIVIVATIQINATKTNGLKIINDSITLEVGDELNLKVKEFVKADKEVLLQIKLDASDVDANKTGEYTVSLFYKNKEYKINVIVIDTKAPKATFKNRYAFTNNIENLVIDEMFESVKEYSKYEAMFISYEKVADLEEITDEKIKALEEALLESCEQKMLAEQISEATPTEEGIYRSTIKLEDEHGNTQYEEIYIILDRTAPVIEGVSDVTIETSNLSQEPETSVDGYQVTDNVDGVIASSDIFCKLELTDNEKYVYVNHVSDTDRAGNNSTVEVTITLVQKKSCSC